MKKRGFRREDRVRPRERGAFIGAVSGEALKRADNILPYGALAKGADGRRRAEKGKLKRR